MRSMRRIFLLLTVAALMAATAVATAPSAMADVFPSRPGQHVGGPPFTSGSVGNGGGGALVVHIGNEACVTHFKGFEPTGKQTGGCD